MPATLPRRQAPLTRLTILVLLLVGSAFPLLSQDDASATPEKTVDTVLVLGPFNDTFKDQKQADWLKDNLFQKLSDGPFVRAKDSMTVAGTQMTWSQKNSGSVSAEPGQAVLVAFNLDPVRFTETTVGFTWDGSAQLRLGRNKVALSGSPEQRGKTHLQNQSYQAFLLLHAGESATPLANLKISGEFAASVAVHTQPKRRLNGELLYGSNKIQSLALSPDGRYVILGQRGRSDDGKNWESVLEIRSLGSGLVKRIWHGDQPANLAWKADSKQIAYTFNGQLIREDVNSGRQSVVLEKADTVGQIHWVGDRLLLQTAIRQKERGDGAKLYQGLNDRWSYFRSKNQLVWCDPDSGWLTPITDAAVSADLLDVDAQGRILYSTTLQDHAEPPHYLTVLTLLDTRDGTATELTRQRTMTGAALRGDQVLIMAGPNAFDGIGRNIGTDQEAANDYDTQLFLMNPSDQKVQPLTKDFDPAVNSVAVNARGQIVFSAYQQDRVELFYVDGGNTIKPLENLADNVDNLAVSDQSKPVVVWSATAIQTQEQVFVGGLDGRKPAIYWDPAGRDYRGIQFGEVRDWDFQTEDGTEIDGRIYLPNNFASGKKYPLIVYYYGGVVPVTRAFGGRYPKNYWASQGYVVYVLQPSGTVGYGQEFSARHLNAWGKRTADDIIASSKAFLAAHDFVDPERVGIIGASYGGFMTMYLTTRTDMYRTAISHAGISNLTEYWGYGWWGYLYNGVAGRGSFPWNNRELYTEQSPVYAADKVTTPLLLVTGDSDTNVPPSQSHVMYSALKLLDKETELIEFAGENHHILGWENRMLWWSTMTAWFDKDLKDEPQWWNHLYPEPK
ncbi:prolyl oligopeptidase family serine peptidase [Acanthopleuribacter pedis]|uniref:S9 family peptidase n=1 Tax=Acanthopleuribacter pedis TaxID=442870 RepID=A0A8J7QEP3_9BACT|nr:prolyl oligopeptidase family serine peptidase [Acanthopleuribacter pedis]MBO1318365.1 S9 family peptidase [Acanthopleuribacter pedis]